MEKKLKLGLFSYSYHLAFGKHDVFKPQKPIDIYDFMDRAHSMGLDGIQIDICHLEKSTDEYLFKVRDYAKSKGFYIEYGSTGIEERHTEEQLEIAKKLDARLMRTFMGFNRYDKNVNPEKEVRNAIKVIQEIKPKALKYGIKIAIENHCDATTDEILEIMKEVATPDVGMCVDLGNFMIHQENPTEAVKKLAPYIINTHFKDYDMKMENWGFKSFGVPLGEGVIELKEILDILVNESGLDNIMLEIPVEKEVTEELTLNKENNYIRQSVKYAREVLKIQ